MHKIYTLIMYNTTEIGKFVAERGSIDFMSTKKENEEVVRVPFDSKATARYFLRNLESLPEYYVVLDTSM